MRNPERIKKMLSLIEEIWIANPDLRLCQLIGNCFPSGDLYYIEDNTLRDAFIKTYVKSKEKDE